MYVQQMMYDVLYDSMLAMYKRQGIRFQYLNFYAISSLVAMEFINCLTIIVFLAYLDVGSVRELFQNSWASKSISAALVMVLWAINYMYLKFRARSRKTDIGTRSRLHWVASLYMAGSVAVAIYASTLVSTFRK
jgi:hypothetical protein